MKMRLVVLVLVIVIAVIASIIVANFRLNSANSNTIHISGNIEVDDAALSFQIAGLLIERAVDEGDVVDRGQLIARLDAIELEHQVALRRAEVAAAEAVLSELNAGTRPERIAQALALVGQAKARLDELERGARSQEIEEAKNAVAQAQADVEKAEADVALKEAELERYKALYEAGVASGQMYDNVKTAYDVAVKTRNAAESRLDSANERLSLVTEGPREEQIEAARSALSQASAAYSEAKHGPREQTIAKAAANVEMVRSALQIAEVKLAQTKLFAPASGVVLSKSLEPGEYARPGTPIVTIGNLDDVYLRAYINETDLGKIRLGQAVEVTTDSYPGKIYHGSITFISSEAEFTPKVVQTSEERVKLVYRIKIRIANRDRELKPGMPADAKINIGGAG